MEVFIIEIDSLEVLKVASCSALPLRIICQFKSTNRGLHYKTPSEHYVSGIGDFMKSLSFL